MKLDWGLLILRVGVGLLMAGHGLGKVMDLFGGKAADFPDPIGVGPVASLALAAFAEFLCALLVVFGIKTRWAAIPPVITMLVAVLIIHANDPFDQKEHPLLFAIPFLALAFTGAGRFSVDAWLERRRGRR